MTDAVQLSNDVAANQRTIHGLVTALETTRANLSGQQEGVEHCREQLAELERQMRETEVVNEELRTRVQENERSAELSRTLNQRLTEQLQECREQLADRADDPDTADELRQANERISELEDQVAEMSENSLLRDEAEEAAADDRQSALNDQRISLIQNCNQRINDIATNLRQVSESQSQTITHLRSEENQQRGGSRRRSRKKRRKSKKRKSKRRRQRC